MTVYARSDVGSITLSDGRTFDRPAGSAEFSIGADAETEAWLLTTFPDQWSGRADQVPLTPDEAEAKARLAKDGNALTHQLARAMAEAAAAAADGGPAFPRVAGPRVDDG
jgi:hypothetical protein